MISSVEPSQQCHTVPDGSIAPIRSTTARQAAIHDSGLVGRFNTGDDAAFVEIAARHRERLFAIAFAVLKNHGDAEEVVQDALIRAHRGLARFRGDCSLATWLHRIALNLARNRYWYFFRRYRHANVSFDSAFSADNRATLADRVASDTAGPQREAIAREWMELVTVCMHRLGAGSREILILRFSGHPYCEIGRKLGIRIGTVKSRIARARGNLRSLMTEIYPETGCGPRLEWVDAVGCAGLVKIICI